MKTFKKNMISQKKTYHSRYVFGARSSMRSFNKSFEQHQAICAACRKTCEVPFEPNGKKPVYCRSCFRVKEETTPNSSLSDFRREERGSDHLQVQLAALNVSIEKLTTAVEAQTLALSVLVGKKKAVHQ